MDEFVKINSNEHLANVVGLYGSDLITDLISDYNKVVIFKNINEDKYCSSSSCLRQYFN